MSAFDPRVLASGALLLLAACGPATPGSRLPPARLGVEVLVLLVHGSGDTPATWADAFAAGLAPQLVAPGRTDVVAWDWSEAARDKLSAAAWGEEEGTALAEALAARRPAYAHVHVVAHSAGAHVAHALVTGLAGSAVRPTLHATFLDPFTALGLFDWSWGESRFGQGADFAEHWLDTGDGVPSTETPLQQAHTFDVTASRPDAQYPGSRGHWWPIEAYRERGLQRALEVTGRFDGDSLRADFPRGEVSVP